MRRFFLVALGVLAGLAWPGRPAKADPGFPAVNPAQPAWDDGPTGAFKPIQPSGQGKTVNVDGNNGLDQNDGSAGSPVKTIHRALELAKAGDTVLVVTGTYHEQVIPLNLAIPASRSKPVTIQAQPADGQSVVIDGTGVVPVTEGTLTDAAGISLFQDSDFVVVGFLIQNWSAYGLAVQQCSDVVVRGCTFRNNGSGVPDPVDMVVISSHDTVVSQNLFDSATKRALDDRATDTLITGNRFSLHTNNAVKVGPHPEGQGSRVVHNVFFDNPATRGVIQAEGAHGVAIERNLVVRGGYGIWLANLEDSRILLNTVVGFVAAGFEVGKLTGCRIEGNIVASNNALGMEITSLQMDAVVDRNLYYQNNEDIYGGDPGPNDVSGDPKFHDPTHDIYTLDPGSPAQDRGPPDLPVPEGGGTQVDIGAFEIGAGNPPWQYQVMGSVADLTPAILWTFVDRDTTAAQSTYHVRVDTSPAFDSTDLLDSSWQQSASARWIVPKAFALKPGRWYLRVKVQDSTGAPSPWSEAGAAFQVNTPPTCMSQGGTVCAALDTCQGTWLVASDQDRCCQGSCIACPDKDGDGHQDKVCGGDDCDDGNPAVHPGVQEICDNGIDDNCDGKTDLSDPECGCIDHDGDGYGQNCPAGPDCDDTVANVNPGAPEICDNVDNNCDGRTDEGFDLQHDPGNCGECNWKCSETSPREVCDLGQCARSCGGGRSDCSRSCIDTSSDLDNCGGCGAKCDLPHAGEKCSNGQCLLTACEAGYVDLNHDPSDGCEYACTPTGPEICGNHLDDNCDGQTDENCGGGCGCSAGAEEGSGWTALAVVLLLLLFTPRRRP